MEKIKSYISILLQEAQFLFDLGLPLFLADPKTRRGICNTSEFDPITDREHLIDLCEQNPGANLEIAIDKELGFVALRVEINDYGKLAEESLQEMLSQYGETDTLTYREPSGDIYYIFRNETDASGYVKKHGIRLLNSNDCIAAYPSLIDGIQVIKLGTATSVQNLSDWLAGSGVAPLLGHDAVTVIAAEEVDAASEDQSPMDDLACEAESISETLPVILEQEAENIATADPIAALSHEIAVWVNDGNDKSAILTKTLEWNRVHGTLVNVEVLVSLVEKIVAPVKDEENPPAGEELLFRLAEEIVLFHDEKNEPYFFYEGESFKAPSKAVENRLKYHYLNKTKNLPNKKDLNNVMAILESKARFEGKVVNLKNRVAATGQEFVYDLHDKRYLKVTAEKWEIIPANFPLYRRFMHMQPQLEPIAGGDPWEVFDFLTVEKESRLLVLVYIVSLFVPRVAHPVFAVFGDQGAAKSFMCTVINRLVDPTLTERVIQPKNERDLIQTLRQKYVTVLDNLSKIDNRVSDIFCQVCTGASISYRQLYTDEGENIAQFLHVVILNSISLAIANADLMDRSIILKLHRINPADRKPEQDLWDAFERARPHILGGIFDTLVKALAIYQSIGEKPWPRLADFAKWGYAIAEALGESGDQFLEDFSQNVKRQNESVVEKNVLCQTVIRLMSDKETYLKSVGDVHAALKNIAGADHKDSTFPKLPQNLRSGLDILRSPLLEHGITYQYLGRGGDCVRILFAKTASPDTSLELTPKLANDVADVADVPEGEIPEVEFDESLEVVNA